MMKKSFFRVKQRADQAFLGADKTKDLDYRELEIADERVEYFKKALQDIHKRISYSGNNISLNENVEKRMKKYPEHLLGSILLDYGQETGEKLFKHVAYVTGGAELQLAKDHAEHEQEVDLLVINPIADILEKDVPNIGKNKRNLAKYILDLDAARNRYNKNGASRETIKEEMEGADQKVEQTRDNLAVDMFTLLRKENELAQKLLQLLKLQKGYYHSALTNLEAIIPELEKEIGNSEMKPVFGVDLEEHLRVRELKIAYPLQLCVTALMEHGLSEEGLFRISGSSLKVKRLKLSIDSCCFRGLLPEYDVPVLASTLKSYLRELPEPLLTYSLHDQWLQVKSHSEHRRLQVVQDMLRRLPEYNRINLGFLIQFLAKVLKNADNKMTASNIAIVIAPNLLWSRNVENNTNMHDTALVNFLVEFLINNAEALFPEDYSHHVLPEMYRMLPKYDCPATTTSDYVTTSSHCTSIPSDINTAGIAVESPKPHNRRKQKPAPIPPMTTITPHVNTMSTINTTMNSSSNATMNSSNNTTMNSSNNTTTAVEHVITGSNNYYPSGSSTLTRSHKLQELNNANNYSTTNTNHSGGVNSSSSSGKFLADEIEQQKYNSCSSLTTSLELCDDGGGDGGEEVNVQPPPPPVEQQHTVVSSVAASVHVSKAKAVAGVQQQMAGVVVGGDVGIGGNGGSGSNHVVTPVAAPRVSLQESAVKDITLRTTTAGSDVHSSIRRLSRDCDVIELRPTIAGKPTIPVRPASLKPSARPVTIQNGGGGDQHKQMARSAGHDAQLSEKEKFLHQSQGGGVGTVVPSPAPRNFDASTSCKSASINGAGNTVNSNNSNTGPSHNNKHTRTRSDGNIVDIGDLGVSAAKTPPSPRPLSKPSQPPPPPPTNTTTNTSQPPKTDSTDL